MERTKVIVIRAGKWKHLLFTFKNQVSMPSLKSEGAADWSCHNTEVVSLALEWMSSSSGCGSCVRPSCEKGFVVHPWFVHRNSRVFISIFPPLYLSSFFQTWRKCPVHQYRVTVSTFPPKLSSFRPYGGILLMCEKRGGRIPLLPGAHALPAAARGPAALAIAGGTVPPSDGPVYSSPGRAAAGSAPLSAPPRLFPLQMLRG